MVFIVKIMSKALVYLLLLYKCFYKENSYVPYYELIYSQQTYPNLSTDGNFGHLEREV